MHYIDMCDEVSLKPPIFTWLGTPSFCKTHQYDTNIIAITTVLVNKPDGNKRHCYDYRFLNRFLRDYDYQLPLIRDSLSKLFGFNLITALDLRHSYWQINIA